MGFRLRCPTEDQFLAILERAEHMSYSYPDPGMLAQTTHTPGYQRDSYRFVISPNPQDFDRAARAVLHLEMHRKSGIVAHTKGDLRPGSVIAMCAQVSALHVDAWCRVISVTKDVDRAGFTYGTLENHPEEGEESFVVARGSSGAIELEIEAISRPHGLAARLASPISRRLQKRMTERYPKALREIVS